MSPFFSLVPNLLLILIPALSMRAFSEEKRSKTLDLLLTRPIGLWRIVANKILAVWIVVALAFILTLGSFITIFIYALPMGNVDTGAIIGSYAGMLCFSLTLIAFSVLMSALTSNQVIAFISSVIACATLYYGFDLSATLIPKGYLQVFVESLGLRVHVHAMQRGVIDSCDLLVMLSYTFVFYLLTWVVLSVKSNRKLLLAAFMAIVVVNVFGTFCHFRWDLTAEKRYTISKQTRDLIQQLDQPVNMELYLSGDINAGFTRLKQATTDLIHDLDAFAPRRINLQVIDPYHPDQTELLKSLENESIRGVSVNERDRAGKLTHKVLYPWLKIRYGERELSVSLLVHHPEKSGEENLNASIENLEYQIAKSIHTLTQTEEKKIAFLEGHGELPEELLKDISDRLSEYYRIDRGQISGRHGELDEYEVVVIAGAQSPFSEQEKYIIDQYLMQGGKLLLCINGVTLDLQKLTTYGESPSMVNELNLEDMLFTYGIRVNPVLIQDMQCLQVPVNIKEENKKKEVRNIPWFYAPILTPNPQHPVTKDILHVKSEFASTLEFTGVQTEIQKTPLLYTSDYTKEIEVPYMVTFNNDIQDIDMKTFNKKRLPVAALLEGSFSSVFNLRSVPEGIAQPKASLTQSKKTGIIVIASEDIIMNEVSEKNNTIQYFPVGYDKYSQITFGNAPFITNAVNYLTDDADLMLLYNKQWKLRLLDTTKINASGYHILSLNILLPVVVVLVIYLIILLIRKKRYLSGQPHQNKFL